MNQPLPLIRRLEIGNTPSFLGSDWHFKTPDANRDNTPANVAEQVIADADRVHTGERHLYCLGDIYSTYDRGIQTAPLVTEVLDHLSRRFDAVFFVPGNHDLRGRSDPYEGLRSLPKNVVSPQPPDHVASVSIPTTSAQIRVLLCNVLPGADLLLPKELLDIYGIGHRTVEELSQEHPDNDPAAPMVQVSVAERRTLTGKAVQAINPETQVLAVHGLPDPAPIEIPVTPELAPAIECVRSLIDTLGIRLITDPARLRKIIEDGQTFNASHSPERILQRWVGKAASDLGVPLLRMAGDRIGDNLMAMHGHNHCPPYERTIHVKDKQVKLLSYQRVLNR
ncbi:MAG: hypothetical protein Greene041619_87 [Candidatus Peregrinibacteria bacterium Greene0416_19]|nr:MAG: hypothetical protein Greene041619_87 [Candidatus Peregrinibacteria bacterium Greene0416_19]